MKPHQLPKYRLGKEWLNSSSCETDLGVSPDHKLPENIRQQGHYQKSQGNNKKSQAFVPTNNFSNYNSLVPYSKNIWILTRWLILIKN